MKKKFGGRIKAMVSGGAPLTPEVGVFFQSLGLTFLQGYGQTESAPVVSCNRPSAGLKMDTVGPPLADTEVRIAEDGEILVRGELVMHGYWRNEAETARVDFLISPGSIAKFSAACSKLNPECFRLASEWPTHARTALDMARGVPPSETTVIWPRVTQAKERRK